MVAEAPPADARGVREDGAAGDELGEVLRVGLDGGAAVGRLAVVHLLRPGVGELLATLALLLVALALVHELVDELPALELERLDVLLDLRGLERHAFGEHETGAAAELVRLDAGEVAVAADLLLLRALAVDHDGAVLHDELDLVVRGRVLEVRGLFVGRDLLLHAADLLVGRDVLPDAQLAPHDVGDEDAERLARAACRADGTGEAHGDAVGAVVVGEEADARDAFERRDEDAFRQDGEARADRLVERLLLALEAAELASGALLGDDERELLSVLLLRQFSDAVGDAFGADELLDARGEVDGGRDLDARLGVEAALAALARQLVLDAHARLEVREVALHRLRRAAARRDDDLRRLHVVVFGVIRVVLARLDRVVEVSAHDHEEPQARLDERCFGGPPDTPLETEVGPEECVRTPEARPGARWKPTLQ
jgi:hypothetical protein